MAVMRDRPYGNSNFLVDLGDGNGHATTAGFAEVIFPEFRLAATDAEGPHGSATNSGTADSNLLVLRRGVLGALDLYEWWHGNRQAKTPRRRAVTVSLLAEDHATVVLTWSFRNAYPVSLAYSPLRAAEGGIAIETVKLAFERVEMS
jgi:phage tail-like protein